MLIVSHSVVILTQMVLNDDDFEITVIMLIYGDSILI